jgi:DNA repair protein RecO
LQLLSKADVQWLEKEGRELARLTRVELIRPADRLFGDLEGILVASVLAESAGVFSPEDESSELVYRLLDSTIEALLGGVDRWLALRYFESWVLRLSGIFPAPERCPSCGRELVELAMLSGGGEFLRRIGHEPVRRMGAEPPTAEALAEVGRVAGAVRRGFLQHELKSVLVLERTLGED